MTELHLPRADPQFGELELRTSVPVITIKRSSETQSIPTTTTIVLQPSTVQSSIPQRNEQAKLHQQGVNHNSRKLLGHHGHHDSTRFHVLKSKNGRSNSSPPSPVIKANGQQTSQKRLSDTVRVVQNGQRPKSASEHESSAHPATPSDRAGQLQAGPPTSDSPPASPSEAANGVGTDAALHTQSRQTQPRNQPQVNASPFEAAEAQTLRQEQGYSRQSSSDSDKSAESAGQFIHHIK